MKRWTTCVEFRFAFDPITLSLFPLESMLCVAKVSQPRTLGKPSVCAVMPSHPKTPESLLPGIACVVLADEFDGT